MEYSINKLSRVAGVSARTLRYYDEIGLLKPMRIASSGYRIYGRAQVDTLQQILFYRELGFALEQIKALLDAPGFTREKAFSDHLAALHAKRLRLDVLIENVTKSVAAMKGDQVMTDHEKFNGFKRKLIEDNERAYGSEIREKYGDKAVDDSNAKLIGLTQAQFDEAERIRLMLEETLKAAFETGNPAGELAQKACDLHRQWLCVMAPYYSKEYHMGLGEMYVADDRFRANYDKLAPGCTEFLRDAIHIYCKN